MTPLQIAAANVVTRAAALVSAQAARDAAMTAYGVAVAGGNQTAIAAAAAQLLSANAALVAAALAYAQALETYGQLFSAQQPGGG